MINTEWDDDSMPVPCPKCNNWFDLYDGYNSKKWFKDTTICESCYCKEKREIELDEKIEDLKNEISDAVYTLKESKARLEEIYKTYEPE